MGGIATQVTNASFTVGWFAVLGHLDFHFIQLTPEFSKDGQNIWCLSTLNGLSFFSRNCHRRVMTSGRPHNGESEVLFPKSLDDFLRFLKRQHSVVIVQLLLKLKIAQTTQEVI